MSSLKNKNNFKERAKTENGISYENKEKEIIDEKEQNVSKLTNMKVFNGLVKEEKDVFKNLNKKTSNKNTKNKKDLDSYFKDQKNIDLNYISFGDCDNLFVNNIQKEEKIKDKQNIKEKDRFISNKEIDNNKIFENKKIEKKIIEEKLLNNLISKENVSPNFAPLGNKHVGKENIVSSFVTRRASPFLISDILKQFLHSFSFLSIIGFLLLF